MLNIPAVPSHPGGRRGKHGLSTDAAMNLRAVRCVLVSNELIILNIISNDSLNYIYVIK